MQSNTCHEHQERVCCKYFYLRDFCFAYYGTWLPLVRISFLCWSELSRVWFSVSVSGNIFLNFGAYYLIHSDMWMQILCTSICRVRLKFKFHKTAKLKMAEVKYNFQDSLFWQPVNFCSYSCKKRAAPAPSSIFVYGIRICFRERNKHWNQKNIAKRLEISTSKLGYLLNSNKD
jgi:hypothetical protein